MIDAKPCLEFVLLFGGGFVCLIVFFFIYFINVSSNTVKKVILIETYLLRKRIYCPERKKAVRKLFSSIFSYDLLKLWAVSIVCQVMGVYSHCCRDWMVLRIFSACLFMTLCMQSLSLTPADIIKTVFCRTCSDITVLNMVVGVLAFSGNFRHGLHCNDKM